MAAIFRFTRRDALKFAALSGAAAVVASAPAALSDSRVQYRRNVWNMGYRDPAIQAFSFAVAEMKRLDRDRPSNPYAWSNIARVHEQHCPHGNWFFLPWHRMYLYGFERICQHITGDQSFRIPFWDWSNNPFVPSAFWAEGGPLHRSRGIRPNEQLPAPSTLPQNMAQLLRIRTFDTFASPFASELRPAHRAFGALERPHNDIHNCVGDVMQSMMSPVDPLFWVHHANIDRLWWEWIRRGNQNTTNANWLNFATRGAILPDRGGAYFPFRVRDALSTDALSYTYETNVTLSFGIDDSISDAEGAAEPLPEQVPAGAISRTGRIAVSSASTYAPSSAPQNDISDAEEESQAPATPPSVDEQRDAINRILGNPSRQEPSDALSQVSLQLVLQGIQVPKNPASQLRIFLNLPGADATTPALGPHFAGTLSFFGAGASAEHGAHHDGTPGSGVQALFDITEQVTQLKINSLDELTVTMVGVAPAGVAAADAETTASGLQFVVYRSR